jgi:O-antigen/teichoic acid export membrane protein
MKTNDISKVYFNNSLKIFTLKFTTLILNLIFLPIILNLLGKKMFGTWLVIYSFLSWLYLFDFGFGNGMRNYLTKAIARNDIKYQKIIIQNTLVLMSFFSLLLFLIFCIFSYFFDFSHFLNLNEYKNDIDILFKFIIPIFCLQFFLQIINSIYLSYQQTSKIHFLILLGNIIGYVFIYISSLFFELNIINTSLSFLLGNLIATKLFFIIFYFNNKIFFNFKNFVVNKKILKLIWTNSYKLFFINICYVVQFQSINFILLKHFNLNFVSDFNVSFKFFNIFGILFSIITAPLWGAVSFSMNTDNKKWIKIIIIKLIIIWFILFLIGFIFLFYCNYFFNFWFSNNIKIDFGINILSFFIVFILSFTSIFIQILNGLDLYNIQFYFSFFGILLFLPVTNYFIENFQFGIFGIIYSLLIFNLNAIIIAPLQLYNFLRK